MTKNKHIGGALLWAIISTDGLKYKESIVKFSRKYGVAKAAYKFG